MIDYYVMDLLRILVYIKSFCEALNMGIYDDSTYHLSSEKGFIIAKFLMSFALKINIFNEIRCVDSTVIFVVAKLSGYLKDSDAPSYFVPSYK